MVICDVCGKGVIHGNLIRHSHSGQWEKRATKNPRVFLPNLHKGKILLNGILKSVKACASCLSKHKAPYVLKIKKIAVTST